MREKTIFINCPKMNKNKPVTNSLKYNNFLLTYVAIDRERKRERKREKRNVYDIFLAKLPHILT